MKTFPTLQKTVSQLHSIFRYVCLSLCEIIVYVGTSARMERWRSTLSLIVV